MISTATRGRTGTRTGRVAGWSAVALSAALVLGGCAGSTPGTAPDPSVATVTGAAPGSDGPGSDGAAALQTADLVTGLTSPWGLAPLADGSWLVSERDTGAILRVSDGEATTLTTVAGVVPGGEGGLLGLLLVPDEEAGGEASPGTLYVYYTAAQDNRIVTMRWDGSQLGEPRDLFSGIPKAGRHNGGGLALGPDGNLYVGTGEAGQPELAQDRSSLGGKILRLTLDGEPAPDNPFGDAIYSWGHRNVEGLTFDDGGRLWASEFGDSTWDELNLITAGANYGWPEVEGTGQVEGMTNPEVVWRTRDASPAGLAYWDGSLWMAGLRGERLWEIPLSGATAGSPVAHLTGEFGRLRAVHATADEASLVVSTSNTDGRGDPQSGDDRLLSIRR